MSFVGFVDIMGSNAHKVPPQGSLGMIALYATGTQGVEATAAQILAYRNEHVGVALIDQTPSLAVFAAGVAGIADVETHAGTEQAAIPAIQARQKHGLPSTIYLSESNLAAFEKALPSSINKGLVNYGVANYSWSVSEAENLLNQNPNWAYCQYGDPVTNPNTLVPGTNITLKQAQADIDVAKGAWASQFLVATAPDPDPQVQMPGTKYGPAKVGTAWRWVADGTMSLAAICVRRGATVLGVLQTSGENLNANNFTAMNMYVIGGVTNKMPEDLVFYTKNP